MKDWVRLIISVSLLAPVFLISAPSLFAHKFPGRYKPAQNTARSVGTAATTRIPYVVNPRLTLSQQQRVAAFSGAVVDRSVSNRVVEAARLATNHTPASPVSGPITTNIHINAAAQISTLDNGTNLTGVEVLNTYFPAWRQELGGMFSPAQLDAVERTLAATDDWLFVRGEDGELQIRNPDEWDYEARFLTLLQESGVSFTERQIKQLVGGTGIKGFTFVPVFTLTAVELCIKNTGFFPNASNPALSALYRKTKITLVTQSRIGPLLQQLQSNFAERPTITPEQLLAQIEEYMATHNGKFPPDSRTDSHARNLAIKSRNLIKQAKQTGTTDNPTIAKIIQLREQGANKKAPLSNVGLLEAVKKWMTEHDETYPHKISTDPYESYLYKSVNDRLRYARQNGTLQTDDALQELEQLKNDNHHYTLRRTPQQILQAAQKDMEECIAYINDYLAKRRLKIEPNISLLGTKEKQENTVTRADTGTNLTGIEILENYFPNWRQELEELFNQEQLDAIEQAVAAADTWLFGRENDGELKLHNQAVWDYEAVFLTILKNGESNFTIRQIKQLTGGNAVQGFTFKPFFLRMNATGFSCAKGQKPRSRIRKAQHTLLIEEMTEEEVQESYIGNGLSELRDTPAIAAYLQQNRLVAAPKTPEEYVSLARQYSKRRTAEEYATLAGQYSTRPRTTIYRNGRKISPEEMTPEEREEVNIANGIGNHRNHPLVQAYIKENRRNAAPKTAEEYVALARQYSKKPRNGISKNGVRIPYKDMTREEREEVRVADGLNWYRNHPLVKEYLQENRKYAQMQSTEQMYTALVQHIKDFGHYPFVSESSLHTNIYNRLRRYQSTMVDGKYADPWLQKIYELKEWSDRVKRGEVNWEQFPVLFKKHRRTIGEMRREGQQPSPEAAKEFEALPSEEQQVIEEMADNMLTLWENFETVWWQNNAQHIITTPNTRVAFNTVLSTVRNQVPGKTNVNISNVLEQVNGMQLGNDGPDYYRVIYRGDNPRLPRAEDFHNVEEITGMPQQFAEPAYQLNSAHIDFDGDPETVLNMVLRSGVTDREMSAVINAMTPAGWEVRIGAHELLSDIKKGKMHIHIEQIIPTTEEGAVDISYKLTVDARELTRGKNPQQVARTLRYLFSSYLTEEGHQALNNIHQAF